MPHVDLLRLSERARHDAARSAIVKDHALAARVLVVTWAISLALFVAALPVDEGACTLDADTTYGDEVMRLPVLALARGYEPTLDDALAAITHKDARTVRVGAPAIEYLVREQAGLGRTMHIVPRFVRGEPSGFKLFGVREGSVARALGFENQDVVTRIGTFEITSPDALMEAYHALRHAESFTVTLVRHHVEETRVFELAHPLSQCAACVGVR